ncbi:MAG: putative lipid II flippase FtsW [Oscillospiraceae bacterium]|nr:putative lipid II flippase FtsW [Oscillospiraceae bacterium]
MDLPFLMLTLILLVVGLVMVLSASYASAYYDSKVGSPYFYFRHQLIYGVAGVLVLYLVSRINYQAFRGWSILVLGASIVLLILVLPFGTGGGTVGAQRWLTLGPFTFQPSEIAKLGVVLTFSAWLSKRNDRKKRPWNRRSLAGRALGFLDRIGFLELIPYALVLIVIAVLMLLEPHISGTILILIAGAAILFAAGVNMGWFIGGGAVVAAALVYIMTQMSHTSARLAVWLDPWSDELGAGFQSIQSLLAIGSGGLLGLGLGNSRQKFLYLPEPENDFVFAIVCEEVGFIGAMLIIILFALLIIRGYWLALHARDRFGSLLIVGIITLFAFQVFFNIGVVTGLLPVTGISLPFFSYGGTALIIQLAEMGIVLSVSRQIPAARAG